MTQNKAPIIDFNTPALQRKRKQRALKDFLTKWYVLVGGLAVLATIITIFFYLAYVVVPLFRSATLTDVQPQSPDWLETAHKPLLLTIEEQNKVGLRISDDGNAVFFSLEDGALLHREHLAIPFGSTVVSLQKGLPGNDLFMLGLSDGRALLVRHNYTTTYPNNHKVITPSIDYPYGKDPFVLDSQGRPLTQVNFAMPAEGQLIMAGATGSALHALRFTQAENLLTGEISHQIEPLALPQPQQPIQALYLDIQANWLFVLNGVRMDVLDLRTQSLNGQYPLTQDPTSQISASAQLVGGVSLLVSDTKGQISQWFMVRNSENQSRLERIRSFQLGSTPIVRIVSEQRRKGFIALNDKGVLGVFHSTAGRTLLTKKVANPGAEIIALSPRANKILVEDGNALLPFRLVNKHPEISWSALWSKVWYENYPAPAYIWQSTSAGTDFEPKLSLAPLTFGTLKAAFYAMLLAAPLAVAAAIYTAYFMAPAMRRKVKPVIELMEALPTVILGFFAGLFLAPYVEANLPGIFSLLLLTPIGILVAGFIWSRLPTLWRAPIPDGWEAAILIPVVCLVGWFSLSMSPFLENWFFDGNMRLWISNDLGITFDQRNALIVGLAMGFAVIPNIFSIAEDAVFSVPKALTLGSLALGATPWQTLTRVVILTASPGIFAALMIGLGRAVGETMIVLMATGNTPVMELNLFEGMRTLAANVAVEMPESEMGGSHYRVLFLSALVLLTFTFVVNMLAEIVRQRLRRKYASL